MCLHFKKRLCGTLVIFNMPVYHDKTVLKFWLTVHVLHDNTDLAVPNVFIYHVMSNVFIDLVLDNKTALCFNNS